MRTAETVLGVIRERGRRRLPLENLSRQLYHRDLFLHAYRRLYRNDGARTPGATRETVDGMSRQKIDAIIDALRHERYRWIPVRRTYISKKSGKLRPVGLPTWSDKRLQEGVRLILEADDEPQLNPHSHGLRPGRGCHTALGEITKSWRGVKWVMEGEIAQGFDSLDHEVMLSILRESIYDNRFLRLIANLLKAGYLEDWRFNATLSGAPQGGVVSPILRNLYLDRLDQFVEKVRRPAYNRGARRKPYPPLPFSRRAPHAAAVRP
jgi:retron-type reverse transcriptase